MLTVLISFLISLNIEASSLKMPQFYNQSEKIKSFYQQNTNTPQAELSAKWARSVQSGQRKILDRHVWGEGVYSNWQDVKTHWIYKFQKEPDKTAGYLQWMRLLENKLQRASILTLRKLPWVDLSRNMYYVTLGDKIFDFSFDSKSRSSHFIFGIRALALNNIDIDWFSRRTLARTARLSTLLKTKTFSYQETFSRLLFEEGLSTYTATQVMLGKAPSSEKSLKSHFVRYKRNKKRVLRRVAKLLKSSENKPGLFRVTDWFPDLDGRKPSSKTQPGYAVSYYLVEDVVKRIGLKKAFNLPPNKVKKQIQISLKRISSPKSY